MDFKVCIVLSFIAYAAAKTDPPKVTGVAKHNFLCPSYYDCRGKEFKNYKMDTNPFDTRIKVRSHPVSGNMYDYFISCAPTGTWCMACPHHNTWYDERCDACLFPTKHSISYPERCPATPPWIPAVIPNCPAHNNEQAKNLCKFHGPDFCGNVANFQIAGPGGAMIPNFLRRPTRLFLMCWMGEYRACQLCQNGLVFYEGKNWKGEDDQFGHCA